FSGQRFSQGETTFLSAASRAHLRRSRFRRSSCSDRPEYGGRTFLPSLKSRTSDNASNTLSSCCRLRAWCVGHPPFHAASLTTRGLSCGNIPLPCFCPGSSNRLACVTSC